MILPRRNVAVANAKSFRKLEGGRAKREKTASSRPLPLPTPALRLTCMRNRIGKGREWEVVLQTGFRQPASASELPAPGANFEGLFPQTSSLTVFLPLFSPSPPALSIRALRLRPLRPVSNVSRTSLSIVNSVPRAAISLAAGYRTDRRRHAYKKKKNNGLPNTIRPIRVRAKGILREWYVAARSTSSCYDLLRRLAVSPCRPIQLRFSSLYSLRLSHFRSPIASSSSCRRRIAWRYF